MSSPLIAAVRDIQAGGDENTAYDLIRDRYPAVHSSTARMIARRADQAVAAGIQGDADRSMMLRATGVSGRRSERYVVRVLVMGSLSSGLGNSSEDVVLTGDMTVADAIEEALRAVEARGGHYERLSLLSRRRGVARTASVVLIGREGWF